MSIVGSTTQGGTKMLIELAQFSKKLQEYRQILQQLQNDKETYQRRRERLSKLTQRRKTHNPKADVVCHMCNANIEIENSNSFATCRGCEQLVCRSTEKQCCRWIPAIGIWECQSCQASHIIQQKAGEWLLGQLTSRLQTSANRELFANNNDTDEINSSTSTISTNQKVKVREFVEELLSSMLNGPLDDVSVGPLSSSEKYLPLCENQQTPDSPSDQYFELRKLLQRVLEEVAKLPELLNQSGHPLRPEEHLPYFSPKKYEQLLATAVLNKVVDDYRNPKNFEHVEAKSLSGTEKAGLPSTGASPVGSAPTPGATLDINHNRVPGNTHLSEDYLRQMSLNRQTEGDQRKEELDNQSLSESDESYLSDYIQKHTVPLPDLSDAAGSGSGQEDDVISLKSNATDGTWEENWLFKKRQLKSTETSIAMLVPSPTEEVKALIGDKNADEISDLSEAGSEAGDLEIEDPNNETKGKATIITTDPEPTTVLSSLPSMTSHASPEPVFSEAKNEQFLREETAREKQFVDNLISIDSSVEKTEAANIALLQAHEKSFLREENNNIFDQQITIDTDDGKLLQERRQSTSIASGTSESGTPKCDRKEIPIDRDQAQLKHAATKEPITESRDDSRQTSIDHEILIPGSIAEREHLKWRNASPIPNNPYSPDVLQKRLSESNRKSYLADFDRLSAKDLSAMEAVNNGIAIEPVQDTKEQVEESEEPDRSLQTALGEGDTNRYQRYGRDYYINDAKQSSGSRKHNSDIPVQLTHSTDDEKSLLLSNNQERPASKQPTPATSPSHTNSKGPFPFVKSSSYGNVINQNHTEDIFSAGRPIELAPGDPVLKKATKVDCLSTPTRKVYLIPADEPVTPRLTESSSELSINSTSRADESLTLSEDSDITRIYDIGTGEAKVIQGNALKKDTTPEETSQQPPDETSVLSEEILQILPQLSTTSQVDDNDPVSETNNDSSPNQNQHTLHKPRFVQVKPLSPETIKFFAPKKPFHSTHLGAPASLSQSTSEIREFSLESHKKQFHSSLHIEFPASRNTSSHEFIIEKEVRAVLPSVKELAKCYSESQQDISDPPKPIHKPRDFIRQSSDMLHEEHNQEVRSGMPTVENKNRRMYSSTSSINAAEELREIRRLNIEAYSRSTYVPKAPGHSITARSLSKQIREELKTNATDDRKVQDGHKSPERPSSPVFAPGHLRSSIQFFENLRNK